MISLRSGHMELFSGPLRDSRSYNAANMLWLVIVACLVSAGVVWPINRLVSLSFFSGCRVVIPLVTILPEISLCLYDSIEHTMSNYFIGILNAARETLSSLAALRILLASWNFVR